MKTLYSLLLMMLGLMLVSGCQVVDKSRVNDAETDTIPWNTRAGWEDTTIGVPY